MKRFYKEVAVVEGDSGFLIKLDGREVKTPEKGRNISPTRAMAEAICKEWQGQGDDVDPAVMPMAKLQNTALDRVATRRDDLIDELVKYAGTDLLCYHADQPEKLAHRQAKIWQPLLDWVLENHDVTLTVTRGIIHVAQDAGELAKLKIFLDSLDHFTLAAFYNMTTLCGSVSIALNLLGKNISVDQAWTAAQLDEHFQIEQWGIDDEAKARHDNMKAELDDALRFLDLLKD